MDTLGLSNTSDVLKKDIAFCEFYEELTNIEIRHLSLDIAIRCTSRKVFWTLSVL